MPTKTKKSRLNSPRKRRTSQNIWTSTPFYIEEFSELSTPMQKAVCDIVHIARADKQGFC